MAFSGAGNPLVSRRVRDGRAHDRLQPMSSTTERRYASRAALLLCTLFLAGCASIQRAHDAVLLLADVQAGSADSQLKRQTDEPEVETLEYRIGGRSQVADRYQTAESRRGSLVLIHGFTADGRRDPRLVGFALSLARSGFQVLVPEIPGLTDMAVGSAQTEEIATALRFATHTGASTGLAAMSLAAGSAVLAAMEADTAPRVGYLLLVGGYYDIIDVLRYATTGADRGTGRTVAVSPPMREGKWLLLSSQLHHLDHPSDRAALHAIARARLHDAHAPVQQYLDVLTVPGRAVYELITNTEPDRVEPLVAKLPHSVRKELAELDLARQDLGRLQARLLLIHGANDPVIPLSHSERLAQALPPGQAELVVPANLAHVDLSPGLRDSWELWRAARRLLALADQTP
jgi:pimeloyl-ACP methyl ester carboxylesterase